MVVLRRQCCKIHVWASLNPMMAGKELLGHHEHKYAASFKQGQAPATQMGQPVHTWFSVPTA